MKRGNARRRGRILRVKQGYNPNSSSMGSIVFALPSLLLGTTVLFGAVAGFIASAFLRERRRPPTRGARSGRRREASNGDGA